MAEDELPNEIKKLKIAPIDTELDIITDETLQVLNPFFKEQQIKPLVSPLGDAEVLFEDNAQQSRCRRCRLRRRSESLLDEFKTNSETGGTDAVPHVGRTCKHGATHKHAMKRTVISSSGDRKIYMREPMLRSTVQNCICQQRRKLLPHEQEISNANAAEDDAIGVNCAAAAAAADKQHNFPARGMSDFRSLIEECKTLLQQYTESGTLLPQHNTEQFQCHRTPTQPAVTTTMTTATIVAPETNLISTTTAARSSTTCSQQAGNSNVVCDDVTIDELASYFDTFVHIPKKMSSMAEMMYI